MGKEKAHELRTKKKEELVGKVEELKKELSELRVAQVSNGTAQKLGRIHTVRKNIARVLTVINQTSKKNLREEYAASGKPLPKALRAKKTRAIRRAMTADEKSRKTARQQKKETHFPARVFAVKAL